jgi:hypothetical protein
VGKLEPKSNSQTLKWHDVFAGVQVRDMRWRNSLASASLSTTQLASAASAFF